jgi:hypothetical protein
VYESVGVLGGHNLRMVWFGFYSYFSSLETYNKYTRQAQIILTEHMSSLLFVSFHKEKASIVHVYGNRETEWFTSTFPSCSHK